MIWSMRKTDSILDNFTESPGTVTVIKPAIATRQPMTTQQAQEAAQAIKQRADERQITVEVTVRPIPDAPGHADVVVQHRL